MPRRHRFAAPFVLTAALAPACTKDAPKQEPRVATKPDAGAMTRNPPMPIDAAPAATWAPDPMHPDLLVPTPRHLGEIHLEADLTCMRYVDVQCDPGDKCNPPPPEKVPCPPELTPRPMPAADAPLVFLRDGACHTIDDARVPCPASGPTVQLPSPLRRGDLVLRESELACYDEPIVDCPPELDCNPPAPHKVVCPPDLMPSLINGAKPTRTDAGRCFHGAFEVSCP